MTASLVSAKTTLPQQVRARLWALSPEQLRADSQRACERLLTLPVWKRAKIVLLFAALRDEPSPELGRFIARRV